MAEVDLIVTGGTVLTMAPGSEPIADGAVAVRGGAIVAVGPAAAVLADAKPARQLDAGGGLILPGFVNTHTHLAMVLLRGLADDLPLREWLEQHIWPAERAMMDAEMVALGTRLAAAELLKAGVTTACDMYFHSGRVIEVVKAAGLRTVVPESLIDFATPACPTPAHALARQRELLELFRDDPLVVPAVAPHSPYSVSAENLVKEAELAEEFGAPLIIHLAETRWEVEKIRSAKGVTPVAYLADLGILSERTVAAHCVHVDEADLDLLAEFEVGVASNPASNLKLASGVAPLPQMLARGIKVSFGTDGAASNNTLDLLRDAQMAAMIYKGLSGDPTTMPARTVAELLTVGGARVLGLDGRIGTLEPGKRADLICLAVDSPHATPVYDPFSHLAYAARASDVRHTVVDGEVVVEDRRLTRIDEAELLESVRHAAAKVKAAVPR
ncbi:MAG TPA: amidohydrolase [Thermoanaerobaculaceae bacterium]|nr:amidohydrolase [Thermoanaerobaculaceae bacterium]